MSNLILPGDPMFDITLATPRPDTMAVAARDGNTYAFIARPGEFGLLTPVTEEELDDYLESGEYEERMSELIDDDTDDYS